ncbi:ERF family protein [Cohnella sp. GCM10020058]|uniref:ERF family protein n=1 Tax=Cohnella sp. GCM10020058 TaxID=3317330 RepID=UPI00363BBEBE
MIFSETNSKISPALVKSWGEMESPKHNTSVKVTTKNGGSYTFEYTDLGGILDEAKRVLKENGISVIQSASTVKIDNQLIVSVETLLLHESGEWVKSEPLQVSAAVGIQDMGGQITYMKRYSLSAMLGLSTEKDDDANGAAGNTYDHHSRPPAALKAKYKLGKGSMDGFDDWVKEQSEKGRSFSQMESILSDGIKKKKEAAESAQ